MTKSARRAKSNSTAADQVNTRPLTVPPELLEQWQEDKLVLEQYGAEGPAKVVAKLISDIRQSQLGFHSAALTVKEAASESGYTADTIRRQIRLGKLRKVGKGSTLRVWRADLPKKPGVASERPRPQLHGTSRQQVARSLIKKRD